MVGFYKDNQTSSSSKIYLTAKGSRPSTLYFSRQTSSCITQKLNSIIVDGVGAINFEEFGDTTFPHGQRHLFLDDLEIKEGSGLFVREWAEGRDHILVRRDSEHLQESLKRIQFEGYDPNAVHLEDYDKDYWEINAMPEPATYGAGLIVGALGIAYYRRRQKQRGIKQAAAVG